MNKNPTSSFQNKNKDILKRTHLILTDKGKPDLIMMKLQVPTFKAFPKIHKTNVPIRPIVNFRKCPSYNLSKFLHNFLPYHFLFNNNKSIKKFL